MGVILVGSGSSGSSKGPTVQLTDVEYSLYPANLANVEYGE